MRNTAVAHLIREPVPRFIFARTLGDKQKLKGSGVRQIVRAAGEAKDRQRRDFTLVHTHQDGTASSASAFDRRIRRFQHRRRRGHRFNKRRWNDLEGLLRNGGHAVTCSKFGTQRKLVPQSPKSNISGCRQLQFKYRQTTRLINVAAPAYRKRTDATAEPNFTSAALRWNLPQ
jgi:hypothetical protein